MAGVGVAYVLSERHPKLRQGSRLLLVGDSMAVGLSPYLGAIARDEKVPFRSVAREGRTITDYGALTSSEDAQRLERALREFQPTLVLVALGTNDEYLAPASLDAEEDDLDALLDLLEPYDVAWIGVPELPKEDSNGAVQLIKSTGVPYFPSERLELERAPDGLHPTAAGYAKWAGMLWSWLS